MQNNFKKKRTAFTTDDCFMELELKNAEISQLRVEN